MDDILFLDFETYFDTHYSLKKLTTAEYVNHKSFKVWGLGARFLNENETTWLSYDEVKDYLLDLSLIHI